MNLNMMNEAFKRKYSNTLTESINDTDKEQLRKALVLRSMNVVANGGNIKSLEIALQDVIENFYPDHCWWEVTDCQIFNELLGGCNPREICDRIVDQLKPEFSNPGDAKEMMSEDVSSHNGNDWIYPSEYSVSSLSDIQKFVGCPNFDWTAATEKLSRSEKKKVLSIITSDFTLPRGMIRVEWPITANAIANVLHRYYENVEVDNSYRVGYHLESAIHYSNPISTPVDVNTEEQTVEVEEALIEGTNETKLATNSKGDYLVAASSGKGYTVFNSSDVCIGGFDGESDDEAKQKFQSGKLSEAIEECFTSYIVEELNKQLSRLNESAISPEDQRDSDLIRSMIDKIEKRSNAKFTPEEQGVMQKYGITRNNWQKQLSVGGRPLHPEYDGRTRKVYDDYYDYHGRTVSNGSVNKINYADRARKLPQRAGNQVDSVWRSNGSINAHTNASNSTLQDVERAVQAEQDRKPVDDMKHALWDRKYHTRQADSAIQKYDDAVAKAQAEYNHQVDTAKKWRDIDIEYGNAGRKRAQDKIDTLLRRK